MVLVLNGSGSIDDLIVQCDALGDGCSRRFWKRNASAWQATSYTPDQSVESVFAAASAFGSGSKRLLRALGFNQRGSGAAGGAKILLRAAVASVLNASHPEVGFPTRERDLIRAVNEALESGDRDGMIALADELAANNSLGCPLD